MKTKHKIQMGNSYKVGVDEVIGLREEMLKAFKPVQEYVKSIVYWNDCEVDSLEYKSRDGFIPYPHNCGGLELSLVVPRCEQYKFPFLEFGECDGCNDDGTKCLALEPDSNGECGSESEGHLDARLRIVFMFEGIDKDDDSLRFYLNVCGGNGDAPYFRLNSMSDIFEADFVSKSVGRIGFNAKDEIKRLLKAIGFKQKKKGTK